MGAGLLTLKDSQAAVRTIEQERGVVRTLNEIDGADEGPERNSPHLSSEQLKALLEEREAKLQTCDFEGITDQWRAKTLIARPPPKLATHDLAQNGSKRTKFLSWRSFF